MDTETTKEVAKATNKVAELALRFGAFWADIFGPAAKDLGDIAHGHTSYWKLCNAIKIEEKVRKKCEEYGLDASRVPLAPRIGLPMLEAAVNEDDETLQDMWAELIARSVDPCTSSDVRRCFIDTLKQVEPLDAKVLHALYITHNNYQDQKAKGEVTPNGGFMYKPEVGSIQYMMTIENLIRLGLYKDDASDKDSVRYIVRCNDGDVEREIEHRGRITSYGWELVRLIKDREYPIRMIDWEPVAVKKIVRGEGGAYTSEVEVGSSSSIR